MVLTDEQKEELEQMKGPQFDVPTFSLAPG
jgi:hypothetical protein